MTICDYWREAPTKNISTKVTLGMGKIHLAKKQGRNKPKHEKEKPKARQKKLIDSHPRPHQKNHVASFFFAISNF